MECNQWPMNGHKTFQHNWIDSHCFNFAFWFCLKTIEPFSIAPCLCFFLFSYHRYYFGFHPSPIFCTLHVHARFHLVLAMEELRGKHSKPQHARFTWVESILLIKCVFSFPLYGTSLMFNANIFLLLFFFYHESSPYPLHCISFHAKE